MTEELPVFLVYDFFLFSVTLVVNDSYTKTLHPHTAICTFYDWKLSLTFCGIPLYWQFSYQDIFCCYVKTNIVVFFHNISIKNFALCSVQYLSEVNWRQVWPSFSFFFNFFSKHLMQCNLFWRNYRGIILWIIIIRNTKDFKALKLVIFRTIIMQIFIKQKFADNLGYPCLHH